MSDQNRKAAGKAPNTDIGVGRATGIISLLTVVSRVLGLVREAAIAAIFGAGTASDAFFVAFKIPNLLRRLVAEGSMATAFVPVLSDEIAQSREQTSKTICAVATCSMALTVFLTLLGIFWADELTWLFAPGFGYQTPKSILASDLLKLLFPYVIIVGLMAITSSALQTFGYFALPAAAPAILNISMIGVLLLLAQHTSQPIYLLAMAVPLGGSVALLLQLRALRKIGYPVRLLSPKGVGAVKKLFLLMLPSILSASVYQILVFINTLLASLLEEGSVSWLYFADRVFQFPLGVFSLAVATAVLPTLSRLASANKSSELQQRIDRTLGWITFITVPATIGLIILSQPIVSSIFEYGHFDSNDSAKTAAALKAYAIGLWPISCQAILVRCYLAKKNSIIPAVISSCTLVFNIYFAFALMGPPSASAGALVTSLSLAVWESLGIAALGHTGLALASSISTSITMIGLLLFIHKVDLYPNLGLLIINVFRSVLAGLAMGLVVWGLACYMTSDLFMMLVSVPMGALCYFATAKLLQAPQADEVLAFARRKLQSFSH